MQISIKQMKEIVGDLYLENILLREEIDRLRKRTGQPKEVMEADSLPIIDMEIIKETAKGK